MDPVSLVVGALAAGAATGLTDATADAIKSAFQRLRDWIGDKYADAPVDLVTKKPEVQSRRDALADVLRDAGADSDAELKTLAEALLRAIEEAQPTAAETVGIDLSQVWAQSIEAEGVKATGGSTAVRAHGVTAGSMRFKDIETDGRTSENP